MNTEPDYVRLVKILVAGGEPEAQAIYLVASAYGINAKTLHESYKARGGK